MQQPENFEKVLAEISTATPVQIDEILAWSYGVQAGLVAKLDRTRTETLRLLKMVESVKEGNLVRGVQNTVLGGIRLMESLNSAQKAQAAAEEALRDHLAEVAPFEAEYTRRGGWSRYFLVQDANGHIHRSMHCSTCNREGRATRFGWLTGFSGTAEQDLTDQVGPNACTVCFPWAETIRVEFDAETKRIKAADREAEKAAKVALAAAKGITTPEGEPLYDGDHRSWNVLKTLRAAEIAATNALFSAISDKRMDEDPETHRGEDSPYRSWARMSGEHALEAVYLVRAIAAKKGQTFEETLAVHVKKAEDKVRAAAREWAKDPRNPNRTK